MSIDRAFHYPFTPPTRVEADALARSAAYLLRAAGEVRTGRLLFVGPFAGVSPLDDLPALLNAAGHLCDAVSESAESPSAAGP